MSEHIHIIGIEAESFRRLRFARVALEPGGRLIRITGQNKAGKTSLLKACAASLFGAGAVDENALGDTSEDGTGYTRLRLSNGFTIERTITAAHPKGYLKVFGPDGGSHGQKKLAEWVGATAASPLAFFDLPEKAQRDLLLSLGGDPETGAKVDALRKRRSELEEERRPLNSTRQRIQRTPAPEGERPEPISVAAELARRDVLLAMEKDRAQAGAAVEAEIAARDALAMKCNDLRGQLEEIQAKLAAAEFEHAQRAEKAERLRNEADALPDPADALDEVNARLKKADAVREALRPWEEWDRLQAELAQATEDAEDLTAHIRAAEDEEKRLIAAAGVPVPGISFDDDCRPLVNGKALSAASGAERIAVAIEVAFAVNPDLKACFLDEADALDLDALKELDRLAQEKDFQIFAHRIGLEGAGEIVVEDGVAGNAPVAVSA